MPIPEPGIVDPVCGRPVDPLRARAVGIFGGQTRYFCSAACKDEFARAGTPAVVAPKPMVAPVASVAPKPVLEDVPLIAATPAAVEEHFEPEAHPKRSSASVVIAGVVVVLAVVAVALRRPTTHMPSPAPPVAVNVPATPNAAAPPVAAPVVDEVVPAYEGTLKLGLRRFAEDGGSLRLLLIDESGASRIVTLVSTSAADGAIAPEADFAHATRDVGVVFKDDDVAVERRATELVVRTHTGEKVVARLAETTALRAAPFARARYADN